MKRLKNTKSFIFENLKKLKARTEDYNYDIELSFQDLPLAVKLGKSKKERIQILMMCYISEVTEDELLDWSLDNAITYIEQTDGCLEDDRDSLNKCIKLIEEMEE